MRTTKVQITVRCLDSIIPLVSISEISVAKQAGLSQPWLQTPKTSFLMMWLIYMNGVTKIVLLHTAGVNYQCLPMKDFKTQHNSSPSISLLTLCLGRIKPPIKTINQYF